MDLRVFVLICLAAALRPQPSPAPEVDPNDPQDHAFNETDFQWLRDEVKSSDKVMYDKSDIGRAKVWPSFLKAHPEEGWRLFKKLSAGKYKDLRWGAAESPAWPTLLETHNAEAWQLFQKLAQDKAQVREKAAKSPAWPMLLETHNAEAWQLFQKLAQDKAQVREKAAKSPAWPMLLETHHAEAWHLFEKLATDKDKDVRTGVAESPVWPDLTKLNLSQSLQIFAELMSDHDILRNLADLPSWKAFGKVPPTAVAERDSQELLGIARSLQKVADAIRWLSHESHEIKGLALFDGFSTALRRSTNETWLGEMVKFSLFASNAALRVSPAENIYLDCLSEFFRKRIVSLERHSHCANIFQFNPGFLWISWRIFCSRRSRTFATFKNAGSPANLGAGEGK